ncbi:Hypothetical Protein FCC1311_034992 [Hondaea fermentalgiana]|uniref:DOMON domain-containing protein n=1 Tax=Hondaea fermentalgiana TaxID=2315210 RepID=A0A2R5G8A2_9STRA|nr:Hypothetical Protein FCC1311_034992 [Hondaea fermentalgiana]|eukprot:GBG27277.1 Hypothetical Protein FCC1311_034992 [Hondaea fermentalgiana]
MFRKVALVAVLAAACTSAQAQDNSDWANDTMWWDDDEPNPVGMLQDGDLEVMYEILDNDMVRMTLTYPTPNGWIGVGLSDDGGMVGSHAVIGGTGVTGLPAPVGEYPLESKSETPTLYSGTNGIYNTSVDVQDSVMTVQFTVESIAGRSLDLEGNGDQIIYAVYRGSTWGGAHQEFGSAMVDWSMATPAPTDMPSTASRAATLSLAAAGMLIGALY